MEPEGDVMHDSSSDGSSESLYAVNVDLSGGRNKAVPDEAPEGECHESIPKKTPISRNVEERTNVMPSVSSTEFQEMVIRALFQATGALMAPSSGVMQYHGEASTAIPTENTSDPAPASTWNEATYRKAEVRRNKKAEMTRTSAGEESDSQENLPIPENATAEEKALRSRKLNRWRGKRSRDLTNNRKALKKVPYVIHVDGTSRPRGIHRHQWKAAIRGQCGRLDPSMDNINHHPKHVVDSIWHALEREWEFQGFAHKAREMFEKSATKFMRNRKMQLKYKCQKDVDRKPPNDVSPSHWAKIVDITKKSMKEAASTQTMCTSKKENKCAEGDMEAREMSLELKEDNPDKIELYKALKTGVYEAEMSDKGAQSLLTSELGGNEHDKSRRSDIKRAVPFQSVTEEVEDVEVQISNLRSQLLWLENSRTENDGSPDKLTEVALNVTKEKGTMRTVRTIVESMKENLAPSHVAGEYKSAMSSRSTGKAREQASLGISGNEGKKHTSSTAVCAAVGRSLREREIDMNNTQMECGDAICMASVVQGRKQDVGKGVLMGFGGSKCARKVIPKGWCSIQVTSCTPSGGLETCPFPSGWKEPLKYKTMKDAEGHIILWPENLLHM